LSSNNKPNTIILLLKPKAWERYLPVAPVRYTTHFSTGILLGLSAAHLTA
jgi:hypothetical protein